MEEESESEPRRRGICGWASCLGVLVGAVLVYVALETTPGRILARATVVSVHSNATSPVKDLRAVLGVGDSQRVRHMGTLEPEEEVEVKVFGGDLIVSSLSFRLGGVRHEEEVSVHLVPGEALRLEIDAQGRVAFRRY